MDHTAKIGGGEIAILNLINALDKNRFHPVFVLASSGPFIDRLRASNIETYILELDSSVVETRKDSLGVFSILKLREAFACVRYVRRLSKLMLELDVDLVHTNSLKAHLFGGIAARLAGIRALWHVRDAIDSNYLPRIVAAVVRHLAKYIPNFIVANSYSTVKKLDIKPFDLLSIKEYGLVRESNHPKATVIHDGCCPEEFPLSLQGRSSQKSHTQQVVTLIGRIAEWKGQHIFLRAASHVLRTRPNVRFQIVGAPLFGEQEYEQSLHDLADHLKIAKNVEFLGFREDIPQIIADCDILVHASIIGEPFGQVVIEGMVSSKPVVATRGGALPEIIIDGETGLLVSMGDDREMADAIERILADSVRARSMGAAGRERVLRDFTIDRCAEKFHAVYEQMLVNTDKAAA